MSDFTSRAGKRRKEKAHHPLEPVADKLYSHLRTSAHHILTPSLLRAPHYASPSSVRQQSVSILCKTLLVGGRQDKEPSNLAWNGLASGTLSECWSPLALGSCSEILLMGIEPLSSMVHILLLLSYFKPFAMTHPTRPTALNPWTLHTSCCPQDLWFKFSYGSSRKYSHSSKTYKKGNKQMS